MTANNGNGEIESRPWLREEWIARRRAAAAETGDTNFSQMHFARKGLITEEMMCAVSRALHGLHLVVPEPVTPFFRSQLIMVTHGTTGVQPTSNT